MEFLTILYLFYTFVSFYILFLSIITYVKNKKQIYEVIKPDRIRDLSIIIPCYNAGKNLSKTIESLVKSDYKGLKKIIVVDDCSTDGSDKIIKEYAKKYKLVKYVKTPKNTGNAAGAKNYGMKFANTELIGFSDDDSVSSKSAISKMVGFFNDKKVGAVTSRVLVSGRQNYIVKSQAIEYKIIALTRKLLGFLESIYVTNGPLSIYRREALEDVNGFDSNNLTEDIEITWNILSKGWKVDMSIPAIVYTHPPTDFKTWFHQRVRWNVGGIQTLLKYRKKIIGTGMLGAFIIPFFTLSWFIGLTGFFFLCYRLINYLSIKFLVAKYSVESQVALMTFDKFNLNPTILFIFGMVLIALGLWFTIVSLMHSREEHTFVGHSLLDIFIYSTFYLLTYPPLLIVSFFKYLKGYNTW